MKKLLLLLFLIPNLVIADDFVKKNGLSCFTLNPNSQVSVYNCENESELIVEWEPTAEMAATGKDFCDPEKFDFNEPLSQWSSGTNSRTQVGQGDCSFFLQLILVLVTTI